MSKKLSIKEASKELGLSEHFLRQSIKKGEIPFFMTGSRYILDVDLIEEILKIKSIANMHRSNYSDEKSIGNFRVLE